MKLHRILYRGLFSILFVFCLSCNKADTFQTDIFYFQETNEDAYKMIIDTLDRYDYVPFYRGLVSHQKNIDSTSQISYGLPETLGEYLQDSVAYYSALNAFYSQDRQFINWLLHFENDSIRTNANHSSKDTLASFRSRVSGYRNPLWIPYQSPLSSYIPLCLWQSSNRVQAISLALEFLEEDEALTCIRCSMTAECINENYSTVKAFLSRHPGADMKTLRKLWVFRWYYRRIQKKALSIS